VQRRPPRSAEYDQKSQHHGREDRAGEEQPFDSVLDGMEHHKRQDQRKDEQQRRSEQRMPQTCFE
jgi:hypothetical protein